jgi:hypothetical protein
MACWPFTGQTAGRQVAGKRDSSIRTTLSGMSKRTVKRKLRAKKKANHGKKPNCGRG